MLPLVGVMLAMLALGGPPAEAQTAKPSNLCLTCPRPEPACWMTLYRWQDYNLKGDFGTTVVVTAGQPPDEQDKERTRLQVLKVLPPNTTVVITKSSRIACPPGTRVE